MCIYVSVGMNIHVTVYCNAHAYHFSGGVFEKVKWGEAIGDDRKNGDTPVE